MAYVGETPWHGEGSVLTEGADIETWRREAGLDFEVKKAPVQFIPEGVAYQRTFEDRFVTYRGDDGTPLGLVSDRYKIVQPGEVIEFYRDFVTAGGMKLETAGTLMGSRRVWGLASLDKPFQLPGGDVIRPFFLFATSFDGETSTTGNFSSVRVVCCNTLAMALREEAQDRKGKLTTGFSVGHNRDFSREWAQAQVHNLIRATEQYAEKSALLAQTGLGKDEMLAYFAGLVGVENEKGELTPQSRNKIDRLVQLYKSGPGAELPSARGTLWGALNAVTRFVDHDAPVRKGGSRFASGQFGPGAKLKAAALESALELAVAA
jgi:phage/plasmid-like protein (TIGR03299 family)